MKFETLSRGHQWRPGAWKHAPWYTFAGCLGFLILFAAIAAVLAASDGQPVSTWPTPRYPLSVPVVLALLIGIANLCLVAAINQAYAVAWWLKALRGARLKELQFDLEVSQHVGALLKRRSRIGRFALAACVAVAVSIVDGPIIQRASTVSSTTFASVNTTIEVFMSNASLPNDFSGFAGRGDETDLLTPIFAPISLAQTQDDPIQIPYEGCGDGECTAWIPAPGFDTRCTTKKIPYDFSTLTSAGPKNNITTMSVDIAFGGHESIEALSTINLTIVYKPDPICKGNLNRVHCILRAATVNNQVTLQNNTVKTFHRASAGNHTLSVTHFNSPNELYNGTRLGLFWSMLGGIASVAQSTYQSNVTLLQSTQAFAPYLVQANGQASSDYLVANVSDYGNCTMSWNDPTDHILYTFRQLMFRSAIAATPHDAAPQILPAEEIVTTAAYDSNWEYFGIALGCMAAQIVCIFLLLWGWHRLGRRVTLDFFEIGRAFGAPLLQGGSSNGHVPEILDVVGDRIVHYGELIVVDQSSNMDASEVRDPRLSSTSPFHRTTSPPGFSRSVSPSSGEQGVAMSLLQKDRAGLGAEHAGDGWLDGSRPKLAFGEAASVRKPQLEPFY